VSRFFCDVVPGTGLKELAGLSTAQFPDLQIEYQDRPVRQTGPAGAPRQGVDPHETLEVQRRERFARHVAEALAQEWGQAKADRLVVAAAPKMLGVLRKLIAGPAAAALAGDLAKDLMNIPVIDLPRHFEGLIKV
jgi:protein required for attachment to host cells